MSSRVNPADPSSPADPAYERISNLDGRDEPRRTRKTDSIKSYVNTVLTKYGRADQDTTDLRQTPINILTDDQIASRYENLSAFRRYRPTQTDSARFDTQRLPNQDEEDLETVRKSFFHWVTALIVIGKYLVHNT